MKTLIPLGALLLTSLCCAAQAQSGNAQPTFEVASVKLSPPSGGRGMSVALDGGPGTSDPGRISYRNVGLAAAIWKAYDVPWYRISGPDWMESIRFDITAKLPPGATKEQFQIMLQNLLSERFKLAVHQETRQMPIYVLVVAKGGSKLKAPAPDPPLDHASDDRASRAGLGLAKDPDGFPILQRTTTMAIAGNRARLQGHKERIAWLAEQLTGQARRPVVDATGLTGEYDFTLSWAPNANADNADSFPDLFAALQQQLGLKLESKNGPVEMLVVDHAEKTPTGN